MEISTETRTHYARLSWSIHRRLKDAGIKRNGNKNEYTRALQIIKPGEIVDAGQREATVQAIEDWVKV